MGIYFDEASRKSQISRADHKAKQAAGKIGDCFHKILNPLAKKSTEVELTRLFLEGVTEFVLYTSIRRELISDSAKDDLAVFIKKEFEKCRNLSPAKKVLETNTKRPIPRI
jgi:hypothetical protein